MVHPFFINPLSQRAPCGTDTFMMPCLVFPLNTTNGGSTFQMLCTTMFLVTQFFSEVVICTFVVFFPFSVNLFARNKMKKQVSSPCYIHSQEENHCFQILILLLDKILRSYVRGIWEGFGN